MVFKAMNKKRENVPINLNGERRRGWRKSHIQV